MNSVITDMSGSLVAGRHKLNIKAYTKRPPGPPSHSGSPGHPGTPTSKQISSVKVTHLPPTITKEKLYRHFRRAGEIDGDPVINYTAKSMFAY